MAQEDDRAGKASIKKAQQKDRVETEAEAELVLEQRRAAELLKKKLAEELARKAQEEALRKMNKSMNMLDTNPMRGMLSDIWRDPMKAARKYMCTDGFLY
jgi:hypothetical protein